jgi:hypothetical protein
MTPTHAFTVPEKQNLDAELGRLTAELSAEFSSVPTERVRQLVNDSALAMRSTAKITEFIPVLVRNEVISSLRRTAA